MAMIKRMECIPFVQQCGWNIESGLLIAMHFLCNKVLCKWNPILSVNLGVIVTNLSIKHEVLHQLRWWIRYLTCFWCKRSAATSAVSYLKIFSTATLVVVFERHFIAKDIGFYNIVVYCRPSILCWFFCLALTLRARFFLNWEVIDTNLVQVAAQ